MQYRVCNRNDYTMYEKDTLYLRYDNWDDYSYKTSFNARYVDINGNEHSLGPLKIGMADMEKERTFDHIPKSFTSLPEQYFSLGQDERYYENIAQLGEENGDKYWWLCGMSHIIWSCSSNMKRKM